MTDAPAQPTPGPSPDYRRAFELFGAWKRLNAAGRFEEALQVAGEMLTLDVAESTRRYAEDVKATSELNLERLRAAEARFARSLQDGTHSARDWVKRGEALLNLGLNDAAAQSFEQALEMDATSAPAWAGLGLIEADRLTVWSESGVPEGASLSRLRDFFDRALAADPNSEVAWLYRGLALSDLRYCDDALNCFRHVVQHLNPNNSWAWYAQGVELIARGQTAESEACFERALACDEDQDAARNCDAVRRFAASLPGGDGRA